jgi:hypothetical protein
MIGMNNRAQSATRKSEKKAQTKAQKIGIGGDGGMTSAPYGKSHELIHMPASDHKCALEHLPEYFAGFLIVFRIC